jgi:hypothetical protein
LENLRKLAFTEHVQEPEQLRLALVPVVPSVVSEAGGMASLL